MTGVVEHNISKLDCVIYIGLIIELNRSFLSSY